MHAFSVTKDPLNCFLRLSVFASMQKTALGKTLHVAMPCIKDLSALCYAEPLCLQLYSQTSNGKGGGRGNERKGGREKETQLMINHEGYSKAKVS